MDKKNESNNKNFYDGYTWTYNSTESFNKLFPYITTKENKEQLQKLAKEQGLTLKDYLVLTGLKKLKVN